MTRAHWHRSPDGGEFNARLGAIVLRVWHCAGRWTWNVRVVGVGSDGRARWMAAERDRRKAQRACERAAAQTVAANRVMRLLRKRREGGL